MMKEPKFLVDVGVGKKVENWLIDQGYDTKSVREINPGMLDRDILKSAAQEGRIVITMDKDFGDLVYRSAMPHRGVLLLRIEDYNAADKVEVVRNILNDFKTQIIGSFSVYKNNRMRIRKLF